MSNKYIKNPVIVEAVQFTRNNIQRCIDFTNGNLRNITIPRCINGVMTAEIETLESQRGLHTVQENDYIIKGIAGEFYPCKPDIFYKTYSEIER